MEKREDGRVMTEATIKVHVGEERFIATAEGNGPVNALDSALRTRHRPLLPRPRRRSSSPTSRCACSTRRRARRAVTRVLIESADGEKSWGTVGVSENIIEASWEALVDSVEYGLSHPRAEGD